MGSCSSSSKGGAGSSSRNGETHINGKNIYTDELTREEYDTVYGRAMARATAEMEEDIRQLDNVQKQIDAWLAGKSAADSLGEVSRPDGEKEALYLERDTKKNMVDTYLKPYNDYGADVDTSIAVKYKDGTMTFSDDNPDRFKLTGIDTIIVEGDWGRAYSGKVKVTHDTPSKKWDIGEVALRTVNVGGSKRRLPTYKGGGGVWRIDFKE